MVSSLLLKSSFVRPLKSCTLIMLRVSPKQ
nr:MAG TPA: hypothetical protein [Caudoviricetes sp.]